MSSFRVPMPVRALALGLALFITALLALAIQRLVSPAPPELASSEVPDLDNFIRLVRPSPPEDRLEQQRLPDPPPLEQIQPQKLLEDSELARRPEGPPSPGPLRMPAPDLRINPSSAGSGPWLGEFPTTDGMPGRGDGGDGMQGGAWLPMLPSVRMQPEYPFRARRRGIEGHVVVAFDVSADGGTQNIEVLEARPPGVFDEAVLQAVRKWRFSVDQQRQLTQQRWQYRVSFSLKDE